MADRITAGILGLAIIVIFAFSAVLAVPVASAEQAGTFAGTWVASGKRQAFDFVEGRDVGTFTLAESVAD